MQQYRTPWMLTQRDDGLLNKFECIKWAKLNGFNLPDIFWKQLKDYEEKNGEVVLVKDKNATI